MDWKDINIKKFQDIYKAQQEGGEDMPFKLLAIVRGCTLDEVLNTPISKLSGMMKDIEFLYNEPRVPLVKRKYKFGSRDYRIFMKVNEMTVAQYIDFTAFSADYTNNLSRFLSTLIIPDGHKYGDGYDVDEAVEDIGNYMPVTEGLAVASFFSTWFGVYANHTKRSSLRKLRRMVRKEKDPQLKEKLQKMEEEFQRLRS